MTCTKCGEVKPREAFRGRQCLSCRVAYNRQWRKMNPGRMGKYTHSRHLRSYGLSETEYGTMLDRQGGGCAICGGVTPDGRRLAVDHDHASGRVRGLLCDNCNKGIGCFADAPARLARAARYLEVD